MFVIKSSLGYFNNHKGWVNSKDDASVYKTKDRNMIDNLYFFYADIKNVYYSII